jgi:hypothetical protein
MRTLALIMILLTGIAFTAAAEEGCDCDENGKVEINIVKIEKDDKQTADKEKEKEEEQPAPEKPRDHFRIGITGTSELEGQDGVFAFIPAAFANTDMFPGLYCELRLGHFGIGMTLLGRFISNESGIPFLARTWYIDAIGTVDVRYHILNDFIVDPFIEVGAGAAGRAMLAPGYFDDVSADMLAASIFLQAGAGVSVNFKRTQIGAKFMYRFFQDGIPCVNLPAFDVSPFQASLFVGFSLF